MKAGNERHGKARGLTLHDVIGIIRLPGDIKSTAQEARKFYEDMQGPVLVQTLGENGRRLAHRALFTVSSIAQNSQLVPQQLRQKALETVKRVEENAATIQRNKAAQQSQQLETFLAEAVQRKEQARLNEAKRRYEEQERARVAHVQEMIQAAKRWEIVDDTNAETVQSHLRNTTGHEYHPFTSLLVEGSPTVIEDLYALMTQVATRTQPVRERTYNLTGLSTEDTISGTQVPIGENARAIQQLAASQFMQTYALSPDASSLTYTREEDHPTYYNPVHPTATATNGDPVRQFVVTLLSLGAEQPDNTTDFERAHIVISSLSDGFIGEARDKRLGRYLNTVNDELENQQTLRL